MLPLSVNFLAHPTSPCAQASAISPRFFAVSDLAQKVGTCACVISRDQGREISLSYNQAILWKTPVWTAGLDRNFPGIRRYNLPGIFCDPNWEGLTGCCASVRQAAFTIDSEGLPVPDETNINSCVGAANTR